MEFVIKYMLLMIGIIAVILLYSMTRHEEVKRSKRFDFQKVVNKKNNKPVSNWIFAVPIIVLFSSIIIQDKFFKSEELYDVNEEKEIPLERIALNIN